jgi:polysaccharide export outer membrane protein
LLCFLLVCCGAGATALAQEPYEIGPEDVIRIVVVGQQELSGEFAVDRDGMLVLPVLGKVKAAETTAEELERKLTALLADGYVKRPQVAVAIKEYRSHKVFVTGEIPRQGTYFLKADRTLRGLVAEIGNLGSSIGHEVVVIRPPTPQAGEAAPEPMAYTEIPTDLEAPPSVSPPPSAALEPETFRVNLQQLLLGDPAANLTLRRGDTVHFPKAAQVYVIGQVARPGPQRYRQGVTVQQVLLQAGGVTSRGSEGRIKVQRIVGGERKEFKVKMTDLLEPEDTLVVPERFF